MPQIYDMGLMALLPLISFKWYYHTTTFERWFCATDHGRAVTILTKIETERQCFKYCCNLLFTVIA